MEEVAFVHSLLSRTDLEISSPLVLTLTISFVYNILRLYILQHSSDFLNTNEGNLLEIIIIISFVTFAIQTRQSNHKGRKPTKGDELYEKQIVNYLSCGVDLRIMVKFACHTCIDSFSSSTKILFEGLKSCDKSSNNVLQLLLHHDYCSPPCRSLYILKRFLRDVEIDGLKTFCFIDLPTFKLAHVKKLLCVSSFKFH